jgi:hypothetical protein
VKIKYFVQNGVNHATRIETKEPPSCGGGPPPILPGISKVFATIDQFPTGTPPIGLWVIGGVDYTATLATKFEQEHGPFAISACVEAKYIAMSGTNWLREVETEDARKCVISGTQVFRSFGVIEAFPPNLIGTWQVSGISYTTNVSTSFEQDHGFFAIGAFVEVKYIVSGTERIALSVETHVAPGAGRDTVPGILEAHDSNDDWASWRVNGITYAADPAIEVNISGQTQVTDQATRLNRTASAGSAPVAGQLVVVNFYRGSDGVLYATSVSEPQRVFLPIVSR